MPGRLLFRERALKPEGEGWSDAETELELKAVALHYLRFPVF